MVVSLDDVLKFGLPLVILVVIAGAGMRKVWVWGYQLEYVIAQLTAVTKEKDEWKRMALGLLGHVEHTVTHRKDE